MGNRTVHLASSVFDSQFDSKAGGNCPCTADEKAHTSADIDRLGTLSTFLAARLRFDDERADHGRLVAGHTAVEL